MKTFVAIILWTISILLNAQSWAPIGAKWYYSSSAGGLAPTRSEYYLYEVIGEEIYEGKLCKKINITYYKYQNGDTAYLAPLYTYESNDKVYYYNNKFNRFLELYIFSASIGDTILYHTTDTSSWYSDTTFRIVVDSITEFIVGTDTLEYFHTSPIDDWWFYGGYIQKIGSKVLMLPSYRVTIPEADGPLRCYQDSSIQVKFSIVPCEYRMTSNVSNTINQRTLKIYPNPANTNLNIEFNDVVTRAYDLMIFNSIGQKVISLPGLENQNVEIDTKLFQSGIYFIKIYDANNLVYQGKILID